VLDTLLYHAVMIHVLAHALTTRLCFLSASNIAFSFIYSGNCSIFLHPLAWKWSGQFLKEKKSNKVKKKG